MSRQNDTLELQFVIPEHVADLYSQPYRKYHDLNHIKYMLGIMPMLTRGVLPPTMMEPLAWAVMYHDAVYDIPDPDKRNEELSAELFLLEHGDHPAADMIVQAILSTKTHILSPPDIGIIDLFLVDLDLWGLGDEKLYHANSLRIQEEVGATDEEWAIGRGAWLESFLERDRIYYTPRGIDREPITRKILEDDLANLRK